MPVSSAVWWSIDVRIAFGLDHDVDARVPRQQIEHVVEEADAGRDGRAAGPVEIDLDLDVGFLGLALHGGFAHRESLANIRYLRAFYQGLPGFATSLTGGLQTLRDMPR